VKPARYRDNDTVPTQQETVSCSYGEWIVDNLKVKLIRCGASVTGRKKELVDHCFVPTLVTLYNPHKQQSVDPGTAFAFQVSESRPTLLD